MNCSRTDTQLRAIGLAELHLKNGGLRGYIEMCEALQHKSVTQNDLVKALQDLLQKIDAASGAGIVTSGEMNEYRAALATAVAS